MQIEFYEKKYSKDTDKDSTTFNQMIEDENGELLLRVRIQVDSENTIDRFATKDDIKTYKHAFKRFEDESA